MGGKIVVPETDANINRVVNNFELTPRDISEFWKLFQKLDKNNNGVVTVEKVFEYFESERNALADSLLEILDIEHDGEINFSDFLLLVTSYCFFESNEIIRFCYYTFDKDRTDSISIDDFNHLINLVHKVRKGETLSGQPKASWFHLTLPADANSLTLDEIKQIHNNFPRLFEPAFKLQHTMMSKSMGNIWWQMKKNSMQKKRDLEKEKLLEEKNRKIKKKLRKKNKILIKRMGIIKFLLCPCMRYKYDDNDDNEDLKNISKDEKEEKERQLQQARREAELRIKNPETAVWLKYKEKIGEIDAIIEEEKKYEEELEEELEKEQEKIIEKYKKKHPEANEQQLDAAAVLLLPTNKPKKFVPEPLFPEYYGGLPPEYLNNVEKYPPRKKDDVSTDASENSSIQERVKERGNHYLKAKTTNLTRKREDKSLDRYERKKARNEQRKEIGEDFHIKVN